MKKLMFILCMISMAFLSFMQFINTSEGLNTQSTVQSSNFMQSTIREMATRFEAFKQYLSKKEEIVVEQKKINEFTKNFRFTYDSNTQSLSLEEPIQEIFNDVIAYQLTPNKKYFIIHQNTITGATTRVLGKFLGAKTSARIQMIFIDPYTGKTVASFDPGSIIMYALDPSEELLLIAGTKKPWGTLLGLSGPSTLHESKRKNFRQPSETGAILQYDIYDIASESKNAIIKTIENVQAIQFSAPRTLLIKYDDETTEKIKFQQTSSSFINNIMNIFNPFYFFKMLKSTEEPVSPEELQMLVGAMYDDKMRTLKLTMPLSKKKL